MIDRPLFWQLLVAAAYLALLPTNARRSGARRRSALGALLTLRRRHGGPRGTAHR
ncbi:MAG: hypothetical protein IPJ62_13965 [Betaproteobacteria bacterium]|nr:hypothetical protein [Betaproteobacteria bacterium]